MSLLSNFKNFNNICFNDFVNFNVINDHIGYINKNLAVKISNYFKNYFLLDGQNLTLFSLNGLEVNFTNLTNFFDEIVKWLLRQKFIPKITNEYINVSAFNKSSILFKIERTAVNLFGIKAKGVHLNGYVVKDNKIYLWIAKRSKSKWLFPNKLDNIVAGAISVGYNKESTLLKECIEEANIYADLLNKVQFINELNYLYLHNNTIRNDVMYVYSLELPISFLPYQNDNEVASFTLMEINEVLNILTNTNQFKFNSALATILFLFNMKLITPQNTPSKIIQIVLSKLNTMAKKPITI